MMEQKIQLLRRRQLRVTALVDLSWMPVNVSFPEVDDFFCP
jgi:hypothetical protein